MITLLLSAALFVGQPPADRQKAADKKPEPPKDGVTLPLKGTKKLEFTVTEGTWMAVDLSPDGKTLVFELLGDLYTMPAEGGEAKLLVGGIQYDGMPRFSPDGKKIAFVSDRSGADNLWVIDADGKNPKALTQGRNSGALSPTWTPDGKQVVVSRSTGGLGTFKLHMVDLRGGTGTALVPGGGPINRMGAVFSPDGRFVYYGQRTGAWTYDGTFPQWQIHRFDRRTGEASRVTNAPGSALRPLLSPDGKTLYYTTRYQDKTALRAHDLASGAERWVAFPLDRDEQESRATRDTVAGAAITKDGTTLICSLGGKLQRLNLASGKATPIPMTVKVALDTNPPVHFQHRIDDTKAVRARVIRNATLSPDAKTLAFTAFDRIWTLDVTQPGAQPKRVTAEDQGEFMPTWTPDGSRLVYVTWGNAGGHIHTVPATGGRPTRITATPAFYVAPTVSPDGRRIAYLSGTVREGRNRYEMRHYGCLQPDGTLHGLHEVGHAGEITADGFGKPLEIRTVPIAGGESTYVASGDDAYELQFAPTGDRLFLMGGAGLHTIRLDGFDRKTLVRFTGQSVGQGQTGANSMRVSPDGERVVVDVDGQLYLATLPQTGETLSVNVSAGGSNVPLKQLTKLGGEYLRWTTDGKAVTWTQGAKFYRQDIEADKPTVTELNIEVPRARPQGAVLLRNGRIITMRGDYVIPKGDVLIVDNRIAAVGPSGSVRVPRGAKTFDLGGRAVSPGYIDVHSHWFAPSELHLPQSWAYLANLAYGVTTNRDPQSAVTDIFDYSDAVDAGLQIGPRIYTTGPGFFQGSSLPDKESITNYLKRYKDAYDTKTLKQYVSGDRTVRQYVIQACRELGITPTTEGALDVKLGLTEMLDGYSGHEHALPITPLYDDMVQLLAKTRTFYTPTLLVTYGGPFGEQYWFTNDSPAKNEKLRRFVPPTLLDNMVRRRGHWNLPEEYLFPQIAESCARIVRAGGRVCLGSHGQLQGLGAHWEMWSLAAGGMTPLEVLKCATIFGAEAIGLDRDLGSIETGKLADLVIYDKNPLENIRNTDTIRWVMKNGELFDGNTLERLLPTRKQLGAQYWQGEEPTVTIGK